MFGTATDYITPAEYLKHERVAEFRSEYHRGKITAMSGASRNHNRITANITGTLIAQLRGRACNNYSSDMRVSVQGGKRYLYPDIVVTCGEEFFEDDKFDILSNPAVIMEVLSDSTEAYDRGLNFLHYQSIESLKTYVLITQNTQCVEVYNRHEDGTWHYTAYNEMPAPIPLSSIDCVLSSEDVYDKVAFD